MPVVVLGGIGYWAHKTGKLEEITRRILQAVRYEEKKPQEPPKQTQTKLPPTKLPPINQGVPPHAAGGTGRAGTGGTAVSPSPCTSAPASVESGRAK